MAKDLKMCVLLDIYGEMLTSKQFEIMDCYYNQDYSLAEISEQLGITRQGVRDNIKRAEQMLFECEEKLGLSKKYESNQKRVDKVLDALNDLAILSKDNSDILLKIKEIEDAVSDFEF